MSTKTTVSFAQGDGSTYKTGSLLYLNGQRCSHFLVSIRFSPLKMCETSIMIFMPDGGEQRVFTGDNVVSGLVVSRKITRTYRLWADNPISKFILTSEAGWAG
jgi:hypothetical protein